MAKNGGVMGEKWKRNATRYPWSPIRFSPFFRQGSLGRYFFVLCVVKSTPPHLVVNALKVMVLNVWTCW